MARGQLFTDYERDMIRAGLTKGVKAPTIAKIIGRTKQGVQQQIKVMRENGSIDQLPSGITVAEFAVLDARHTLASMQANP